MAVIGMQTSPGATREQTTRDAPEPARPAALEARSLYRFFWAGDEETLALQGVSLRVERGEVVAVSGPSGSGKSTLLSCLAGLDEPSGGTVWVGGERISHQPEATRASLRSREIGVLFQSGNLLEHLTVAQNVRLAQSMVKSADRPAVRDLLSSVGLADRGNAYPAQLSGGEIARAGVAVALANDPIVLLADEPSGELDSETERRLLELLKDRARDGRAVVIASHSPAVVRIADRRITLNDGRVV
jgi:putative ABC transport system ATP-binding protein